MTAQCASPDCSRFVKNGYRYCGADHVAVILAADTAHAEKYGRPPRLEVKFLGSSPNAPVRRRSWFNVFRWRD